MVILSGVTLPRACFQTCFRNFLRKVITIRLLEAIVGIYQIGVILFCSIILILRGVYMEKILIIINIV